MVRVIKAISASLVALTISATAVHAQAIPASAFTTSRAFTAANGVQVHHGQAGDHDRWRHGRHNRGRDAAVFGPEYPYVDGTWALYNNRTWEPDSYNDWWHDRPDRAFPRWMQSNQKCERMWWSGAGWQC